MEVMGTLVGFVQELPNKKTNPQKEEAYIDKMKNKPEIWQLFQETYLKWEIKDKEELTKKSKLLTAIKESIKHDE